MVVGLVDSGAKNATKIIPCVALVLDCISHVTTARTNPCGWMAV